MITEVFALLFSSDIGYGKPILQGCSQYGRGEMGLGITLLLVVLLIGQRRRISPESPNSTAS